VRFISRRKHDETVEKIIRNYEAVAMELRLYKSQYEKMTGIAFGALKTAQPSPGNDALQNKYDFIVRTTEECVSKIRAVYATGEGWTRPNGFMESAPREKNE
jgi:hypothetical protein